MPGGSRRSRAPVEYTLTGSWPFAEVENHRGARMAQQLSRRLRAAMERHDLSANALARISGVNRQVVTNVLQGAVWPDILTIAELEAALDTWLWPTDAITAPTTDGGRTTNDSSGEEDALLSEPLDWPVIERMTAHEALLLHRHLTLRHTDAVRDLLVPVNDPARREPPGILRCTPPVLGDIASMDRDRWRALHVAVGQLARAYGSMLTARPSPTPRRDRNKAEASPLMLPSMTTTCASSPLSAGRDAPLHPSSGSWPKVLTCS